MNGFRDFRAVGVRLRDHPRAGRLPTSIADKQGLNKWRFYTSFMPGLFYTQWRRNKKTKYINVGNTDELMLNPVVKQRLWRKKKVDVLPKVNFNGQWDKTPVSWADDFEWEAGPWGQEKQNEKFHGNITDWQLVDDPSSVFECFKFGYSRPPSPVLDRLVVDSGPDYFPKFSLKWEWTNSSTVKGHFQRALRVWTNNIVALSIENKSENATVFQCFVRKNFRFRCVYFLNVSRPL